MRAALLDALVARFSSFDDLVAAVGDADVATTINIPRHKSLAEHLWCIIGARESHARALVAGQWQGFTCSLTDYTRASFQEQLKASAAQVLAAVEAIESWSASQDQLLLALHEHEVMHEGQAIRHLYALGLPVPESVRWA